VFAIAPQGKAVGGTAGTGFGGDDAERETLFSSMT
jgi:hypothetical protein